MCFIICQNSQFCHYRVKAAIDYVNKQAGCVLMKLYLQKLAATSLSLRTSVLKHGYRAVD